jgi:hypothetical protein
MDPIEESKVVVHNDEEILSVASPTDPPVQKFCSSTFIPSTPTSAAVENPAYPMRMVVEIDSQSWAPALSTGTTSTSGHCGN